ncbi:uncharacterized protein [Procambarus clarkii]|uniref:uncharacterized protein isoform X1 n=1 Tax=Procambarus clarkii TaxID=6728 RepID=UPI0037420C76
MTRGWWCRSVACSLVLISYVAASYISEECIVKGLNVTVDEARSVVNYTSILANSSSCSSKLWCDSKSSQLVINTRKRPFWTTVKRSDSLCLQAGGSVYLKCGPVRSQEVKLPLYPFIPSVRFINNSSLNVMIPRKEGGQWRVTVTAAGVVKEVVAGANFSLNNFSLNNILVVSGNLTWLKCYDIYVNRCLRISGKSCCREVVVRERCNNDTIGVPHSLMPHTRTSVIAGVCVGVYVVVVVMVLAVLSFRHRVTKQPSLTLPALWEHEEVLLVHTKESDELTHLVNDLAGDILTHTNIKAVHDIFSTSEPEVLASPQSWVLGKLCSQHSTTVVLVSSPGLSNVMYLKMKGVTDYGMKSVLGRDHHPCDSLLNTCLDYMLHTHTLQNPRRVLVVRLRGVETAEAWERPAWATGHLGPSVVYTLPDDHTQLWTALNTPVARGHR